MLSRPSVVSHRQTNASTPDCFAGINWNSDLKYLGVLLSHFRNTDSHWSEQAVKVQRQANDWRRRLLSIFSRARAGNTFLVTRLLYVLQVLHCSRLRMQAFHRIFATFVWCSRSESMRRDNLFLPVVRGGLGVVHLFLCHLLSRLFYFRDVQHLFLKAVLQIRLVFHLPFLLVSTGEVSTKPPWGFLKEVVDTFNFLTARFSLQYLFTLSRKALTNTLLESLFPVPVYRQPYIGHHKDSVLKRVTRMCLPPNAKTFFFKLHTSTLPVKTWLREKGMSIPWSDNCRLCNQPETIDHCFVLCRDAVFFWDVLQRTLKKDIDITPYTIRFLPFRDVTGVPYDIFVVIGLYSLWKCRMTDRHAEPPRPTKSIFREQTALVRSIYAAQSDPPEWLHLLDACVCLPEF
ncbi:uncharacterized protein LOC144153425 [Haemaphysalis longicornis]